MMERAWLRWSIGIAVSLLLTFTLIGGYCWFRGPRSSWKRSCQVCGARQECERRVWIEWEGEVRPTEVTRWLGDAVPRHDHVWLGEGSSELRSWRGPAIHITACGGPPSMAEHLHHGSSTEADDSAARELALEFLADVRVLGERAAIARWQRKLFPELFAVPDDPGEVP
jgi:hypothetical protein